LSIRIWIVTLLLLIAATAIGQTSGVIKTITIRGNSQVSQEAILLRMQTKVGSPYVQATLDKDREAVESMGFFQAVDVRAKPIDDQNWEVVVEVQEWPIVKEIRVVGNKAIKTEDILKAVDIVPGKIFNAKDIQPSAQKIEQLYTKKGFFGRVEEIAPMRESPNTVSISIIELTVNSVGVQGNNRTNARVIRHLIKTRANEPFSEQRWSRDLSRLYSTQWFESVRSIDRQPEPGRIDLIADLKETRTGNFGVGLQVDPRSSFAGFIRLSDTNFRGTGQSVGVNFLQATRGGGPSIDLDYGNPFIDNRDTSLQFSVYSRLIYRFAGNTFGGGDAPTDDNEYTERRTGAAIGLGRPLSDTVTASVSTRFENITTGNLQTTNQNGFIKQDGTVGTVTFGLTRNRRDVDVDPSRGDWLRLELEPGFSDIREIGGDLNDSSVLGQHTYLKSYLEFRKYFSPQPPRGRNELEASRKVFAFRARYGLISGTTPFFEQFFAGGADTIRGYEEDRFWGKQQFLATFEYRHPIQKAFNVILFVDYGGAWGGYGTVNTFTQSSSPKLHLGYGLGLSFRTPLGPLRLDFGFNEKGKGRTHFLIGTSF
jgi:outer membrane protein insertion porin family